VTNSIPPLFANVNGTLPSALPEIVLLSIYCISTSAAV
jgi:hypothetical protein